MEGNRLYKCIKPYSAFREGNFYFFEISSYGNLISTDDDMEQHYFDPLLGTHVELLQKRFTPATEEETEAWMSVKEGKKEESKGFTSRDHLSKREMFAAMAMQGLLANPAFHADLFNYSIRSEIAIESADALLKALNEE